MIKIKNQKSKIKKLGVIIFSLVFLVFGGFNVMAGSAAMKGLNTSADLGLGNTGRIDSIPLAVGKVVGAGLSFIGILFMLLMIYGGFMWMVARGNDQEVTKAKELIQAAIIGLIIVLSAYAITSYISTSLSA